MKKVVDIKIIKASLLRNGHTQEEIDKLTPEEIRNLHKEDTRTNTYNFLKYMDKDTYTVVNTFDEANINDLKIKVRENTDNTLVLIDIIKEAFDYFSYSDIADILAITIKNIPAHKLQKILRIAYREFQETLLGKISSKLNELPIEEYKVIMSHYEKNRSNIESLKNTISELSTEKKRKQIVDMARIKLNIVKDFMPKEIFNDTYKEYLNNTPQKLNLVSEILSLTGIYSKNYLKNTPIEELEVIKEKIMESKREDERDQKIYNQYTQMIEETMYNADEQDFNNVCVKIITNLSQKQILMISEYLDTKNPVFLNRFNTLLREFKRNIRR